MTRPARIVLITLAAVVGVVVAAGSGATLWLRDRLQTPEYCATCHVITPYYDTWKASEFTAHAHAKAGVTCQECHPRTTQDGLRELLVNATHRDPLPTEDSKVRTADCARCHGSHEILSSRTAHLLGPDGYTLGRNPHDSHWGPLECGICHNMHEASVDFCSKCHGAPTTGAAWAASR